MSYTLVFLALLMALVVWWLVKQTVNLRPRADQAHLFDQASGERI